MPENRFTGIDQDTADEIAEEATKRGDYLTLTELEVADNPETGDIGLPVKVTDHPRLRDIR